MHRIYDVYRIHPDGEYTKHHLVGRYMNDGQNLDVLADYGLLGGLQEGPLSAKTRGQLDALKNSPYFRVVNRQEYADGLHPDLIPEAELSSMPTVPARPPSSFEYFHPVIGKPVSIESKNGDLLFNGKALSRLEATRILDNIKSGTAQIRYKRDGDMAPAAVAKMERYLESLAKVEPGLHASLTQLREAVKAGHVHPDVLTNLSREIFTDPMCPKVGNKKSYMDFLQRPRPGVHIRIDGNGMSQVNKIHGFKHGDQAIKAMFGAVRSAVDETVGRKLAKVWRIGGDEGHIFVPSHEHAVKFLRALRSKLESIPPVGGTHSLSVSAGIGRHPEESDQASILAKQRMKSMGYPAGQAKTHVHSLIPGHEGAVPLDPEKPLEGMPGASVQSPGGVPASLTHGP